MKGEPHFHPSFSFKVASGKLASTRKPSRLVREELLLYPHEPQCEQETPTQKASDTVRKGKRKELKRRGRQKEKEGRWGRQ